MTTEYNRAYYQRNKNHIRTRRRRNRLANAPRHLIRGHIGWEGPLPLLYLHPVDVANFETTTLYTACNNRPLPFANFVYFDTEGRKWRNAHNQAMPDETLRICRSCSGLARFWWPAQKDDK